jgi:hypothetical protein
VIIIKLVSSICPMKSASLKVDLAIAINVCKSLSAASSV